MHSFISVLSKTKINALDESSRGLYKIESCQLHRLAIPHGSQKGNALPRRHHSRVLKKPPDTLTSIPQREEQKKTRNAKNFVEYLLILPTTSVFQRMQEMIE
uniref:Uncharacterized protein n=1 Tax=Caenorhabditis tropicalis TaxID=1561998 RepID=A0A1I7V4W1_9PELO